MSIESEIERIETNIEDAYDAAEEVGAEMPELRNSANLASTISTISGGGTNLPDQEGHSDEFLSTNGTDPYWKNVDQINDAFFNKNIKVSYMDSSLKGLLTTSLQQFEDSNTTLAVCENKFNYTKSTAWLPGSCYCFFDNELDAFICTPTYATTLVDTAYIINKEMRLVKIVTIGKSIVGSSLKYVARLNDKLTAAGTKGTYILDDNFNIIESHPFTDSTWTASYFRSIGNVLVCLLNNSSNLANTLIYSEDNGQTWTSTNTVRASANLTRSTEDLLMCSNTTENIIVSIDGKNWVDLGYNYNYISRTVTPRHYGDYWYFGTGTSASTNCFRLDSNLNGEFINLSHTISTIQFDGSFYYFLDTTNNKIYISTDIEDWSSEVSFNFTNYTNLPWPEISMHTNCIWEYSTANLSFYRIKYETTKYYAQNLKIGSPIYNAAGQLTELTIKDTTYNTVTLSDDTVLNININTKIPHYINQAPYGIIYKDDPGTYKGTNGILIENDTISIDPTYNTETSTLEF